MQNQTIFELYTDDNKPKYFGSPKDILKSAKKKIYTKRTSAAATTELVQKIPNRKKKYLMKTLIFVRLKYLKMKS